MLKDIQIKNAKPQEKGYKLYDKDGLVVFVSPTGVKSFRLRYRFNDKEKLYTIGKYPLVSLQEARNERERLKRLIYEGKDPSELKKQDKINNTENTFKAVALEWHKSRLPGWSDKHAKDVLKKLEANIFPYLEGKPINKIKALELLEVLKKMEAKGNYELAKRVYQICNQVFQYAVVNEKCEFVITSGLNKSLSAKPQVKHHKYLKDNELPEFFKRLEACEAMEVTTKLGLKLVVITFLRTGEIRQLEWPEVDFDKKQIVIPAEKMKASRDHIVPLSSQAIAILKQLQQHTGNYNYCFPNSRNPYKCMSENTLLYAMYRLGYHGRATTHGFRSTASTILNESGLFSQNVIEAQLSHVENNKVKAAYNHANYLTQRIELMKWYSEHLEKKGLKL